LVLVTFAGFAGGAKSSLAPSLKTESSMIESSMADYGQLQVPASQESRVKEGNSSDPQCLSGCHGCGVGKECGVDIRGGAVVFREAPAFVWDALLSGTAEGARLH
jgi:hypothetical protein